jgi:uracil-DNA glycosylase
MDETCRLAAAYFSQQQELGMPDYVFSPSFCRSVLVALAKQSALPAGRAARSTAVPAVKGRESGIKTLPKLVPFSQLATPIKKAPDPVRDALVALYNKSKTCTACGLAATRTKFVFGSGNPHAPLMIIGEAPGEEEDRQGLPFVGRAGELLTKMLSAIGLDRKKDVFIANVLKCRPPGNRNPESAEILACMDTLAGQIEIIKPKLILLLGRIAAHSLLKTAKSIQVLRTETYNYMGIPMLVTYHPASLLRNEEYKKPAWEDMRKCKKTLMELGAYGTATE